MAQYIDKGALVAKIQKRLKFQQTCIETEYRLTGKAEEEIILEYNQLLSFINTLEVKEVDLEEEIDKWYNTKASKEFENVFYGDIEECAKYFFELGLNAQQNIHIDITSIDKVIKENDIDPNSKEAKIFKESYYIALEKLKARKGE